MDLNRISDYPDHPEPTGHDAEFNREARPRSTPWAIATVGIVTLLVVLSPFALLLFAGKDMPLLVGGLGAGGAGLFIGLLAIALLFLAIVVFAPQRAGGRD